jgi:hypothetical protein
MAQPTLASSGDEDFVALNNETAGFPKESDAAIELAAPGLGGSLSLRNFTV